MKILFVSVGKEEYLFQRNVAAFLKERGWEAEFVTLGNYNVDFKLPPDDTVVVERKIPGLFSVPEKFPFDLDERVHAIEKEFNIPCIHRLYFTDRIHRPRLKTERQSAFILTQYFDFWKKYLSNRHFNIGFMGHGGEMLRWGAYYACKKRGIPLYQNYVCPLPGRVFLLKNMDYEIEGVDWQKPEVISEEEKQELTAFIQDLRESRKDFVRIRKMDFQLDMPLLFVRAYYRKLFARSPRYRHALLWNYTKESFWKITRKHIMKTLYSPVRDENFIFYPMHYIDDAQIVIRAPHYYNQFALIEILANALPFGYKLYVKEHPSLIGCFPFRQMRDLIKKCKNIRIINPLCHPHNLIKRAKAVATINSTTGFEAILFRKPLLVFGKAWYRDAGFSTNVYALEDLPEKIKDVLNRPTPTEGQILSFLSKLKKHSFKGDTMSLNYSEGNAKDIAVALCKVLK